MVMSDRPTRDDTRGRSGVVAVPNPLTLVAPVRPRRSWNRAAGKIRGRGVGAARGIPSVSSS